jgi:chromosome segregation ATPase
MEDSSNSRSAGGAKSTPQHKLRTSFTGGNRSALGDTESLTQMSGQSNHTTGHLSGGGNSHATADNIDQLRMMLEHARMEERQVMVIHKKLEKEVEKLMEREIMANNQRLNINLELQTVSLEHERLERQVEILQKENDDLRLKLSIMEEREGNRGLDDVLDSMEAKIKELKLKRTQRRVSSPREGGKQK